MAIPQENCSAMPADRKECLAVMNMLIDCVAFAALPATLTLQLEEAQQLIWAREYYQDVDAARGKTLDSFNIRQQSSAPVLATTKVQQSDSSRLNCVQRTVQSAAKGQHPPHDTLRSLRSLASTLPSVSSANNSRYSNGRGRLEDGYAPSSADESGALPPQLLLRRRERARSGDETSNKFAGDSANGVGDYASRRNGGLGVPMYPSSSSRAEPPRPRAATRWTSMRPRDAAPFADSGWSFESVALKRARSTQTVSKANSTGTSKLKRAAGLIRAAAAAADAGASDVSTGTSGSADAAEGGANGKAEKSGSKDGGKSITTTTKKKKAKKKVLLELPSEYLNQRFSELSTLEVGLHFFFKMS